MGQIFQTVRFGHGGLALLVDLNLDRFLAPIALGAALALGGYLATQ